MNAQHYFFAILLVAGAVFADDKSVTFTTLSGEKFENAIVTIASPLEISVRTRTGIAHIPFANLSPELRKQFGYDSAVATTYINTQKAATAAANEKAKQDRLVAEKLETKRARKRAILQKWASDNLVLSDRETQLRAALAAKLYQEKKAPFTLEEFQFCDQETKMAIILYVPEAIPARSLDQ
jgi:hypothetical protein